MLSDETDFITEFVRIKATFQKARNCQHYAERINLISLEAPLLFDLSTDAGRINHERVIQAMHNLNPNELKRIVKDLEPAWENARTNTITNNIKVRQQMFSSSNDL